MSCQTDKNISKGYCLNNKKTLTKYHEIILIKHIEFVTFAFQYTSNMKMFLNLALCLFVFVYLFVLSFSFHSRIFHSFEIVTIGGEGL